MDNETVKWYAIIAISTIVLVGLAYIVLAPYMHGSSEGEGEVGKMSKNVEAFMAALEDFEPFSTYNISKKEVILSKNGTASTQVINRKLSIVKNGKDLLVDLVDPYWLYEAKFIHEGNLSVGCFRLYSNDSAEACGDPYKYTVIASLPGNEMAFFMKSYLKDIKVLAENNALHIEAIKPYNPSDYGLEPAYSAPNATCYIYNYSFEELPVKVLDEMNLPTHTPLIGIHYKSTLCLDKHYIYYFNKAYTFAGVFHNESTWIVNISNLSSMPAMPKISEIDYEGLFNHWQHIVQGIQEGQDPQIRAIAIDNNLAAICYHAKDIDKCLANYAASKGDESACNLMLNETMKERCHEAFHMNNANATNSSATGTGNITSANNSTANESSSGENTSVSS